MATKYAAIKGVKFDDGPMGPANGGHAVVTFDLSSQVYTGGTDTVQLGGGGYDGGQTATTSTLAAIMQNRRRDGKTVAIVGIAATPTFAPGLQAAAAANGPVLYAVGAGTSGGNVTLGLSSTIGGSANVTTAASTFDREVQISVEYTAT